MVEKLIMELLSAMERDGLPLLGGEFLDVDDVVGKVDLDKTSVLRAVGFLKNKGLVDVEGSEKRVVILGILGINYLKKELPERILLGKLAEKKIIPIGEIRNVCGLNENEAKIALGTLRKKAWVGLKDGRLSLNARPAEVTDKMIEEVLMESVRRDVVAVGVID